MKLVMMTGMSKPLRILSVGHSYVVAMNRAILRELAKDTKFAVTVAAPKVFKGSLRTIHCEPEPKDSNLKLVELPAYLTHRMHFFGYHPRALNNLMKQGFDAAHFWEEPYIFSGYQLCRAAQKYQVPYLFRTAQSLIKNYVWPFSFFEKQSLKGANQFVAGGQLVYQAMRDKGWGLPGQVLTLAVDATAFTPFSVEEKTERRRQQLALEGSLLGYLGRLSEEKGLDLLMEVLANLKDKKWTFLFLGSGPYQAKIERWVDEQGLKGRVRVMLVDHQQVPDYLPLMDLLLCPSQTRHFWKEQFGRMIVEAFAAGVPVVASDSGEIPRVVGEAGVVLPESDKQSWQAEISRFLDRPQDYQNYRELGLQRVKQYSAESIAEQYKQVYRRLADRLD